MLQVNRKRDGTYEVMIPWRSSEEALRELEELLRVATPQGVVIRVCRDNDAAGVSRPVKAILSIDPSTIKTS